MLTDERLTELFVSHEFFFQGLLECIEAHYTARISDQEARANILQSVSKFRPTNIRCVPLVRIDDGARSIFSASGRTCSQCQTN